MKFFTLAATVLGMKVKHAHMTDAVLLGTKTATKLVSAQEEDVSALVDELEDQVQQI